MASAPNSNFLGEDSGAAKIKSVRGTTATSGTLERAADVLQDLGKELRK
jgi:hypothetical protein